MAERSKVLVRRLDGVWRQRRETEEKFMEGTVVNSIRKVRPGKSQLTLPKYTECL